MPNFGSSSGLVSQNLSQTMDNQGNPIISSDTTFGASPLGYAARVQALFGLPNATFELTPPDTTATINQGNQLPYWDIQDYSAGVMSGSAVYDSTTNTWGVKLDPGTATTGDYLTMTTRSYLVNDDNLSLRQKALAVVAKNGTYSSTTQWNMNLTATYYDGANTVLHSGTVATILDNTTWTSMAGTTTTGGTAINAAAQYVDLTFTLTATAPVTSATSVTIKSTLLQTSTPSTGGGFLVVNTYYANTTFTVPTGVTYADIICVGAGGGGGGGAIAVSTTSFRAWGMGASGGGGGGFVYAPNQYIGGAGSYTISVGAGGAGGAGTSYVKSGTAFLTTTAGNGIIGANGGASSFGALVSSTGGIGGGPGQGTVANNNSTSARGTAGAGSPLVYPIPQVTSGEGGRGGSALPTNATADGTARSGQRSSIQTTGWTQLPITAFTSAAGSAGGTATLTGFAGADTAVSVAGTGGSGTYIVAGGASGSTGMATLGSGSAINYSPGSAFASAGGGGASLAVTASSGVGAPGTGIAGNGGAAAGTSGCGGGGGGGASVYLNSATNGGVLTLTGGNGGAGGGGFVVIAYVG